MAAERNDSRFRFEWEAIDPQTLRAKVAGGWLVRFHSHTGGVAMSVVPDPEHRWEVEASEELIGHYKERLERLEREVSDPYVEDNVRGEMKEEIENLRRFLQMHG